MNYKIIKRKKLHRLIFHVVVIVEQMEVLGKGSEKLSEVASNPPEVEEKRFDCSTGSEKLRPYQNHCLSPKNYTETLCLNKSATR